jgi:hypothetical protein
LNQINGETCINLAGFSLGILDSKTTIFNHLASDLWMMICKGSDRSLL